MPTPYTADLDKEDGMSESTGPARIREAVRKARGTNPTRDELHATIAALNQASCCGDQGPDARRADDPRWPGNRIEPVPLRTRLVDRLLGAVACPACLRFRSSPMHWVTCR